ncbi:hypothetical protein MMA231_03563 (plasmid) [Asticcacaulis sp. MM231]|uniref:gluconate 2-dehydrogenase subunit 3 family protein n=1 Tax=Asticcacaulis sp. MM231 TaxID=3157666 RepID=UPI0032D5819E
MTTRRQVLHGLILSLGGAAALSTFQGAAARPLQAVQPGVPAFYSADELALVTFLADAIIPRTDTPGAIDVGVPAYLDHLYLTWASAPTQGAHRAELAAIAGHLERFGAHRTSGDTKSRLKALTDLDAAAFAYGADAAGLGGYRAVKSLIATVYYLSEPGATQELQYELVPGRWIASAPISDIGRTWAQ